MLLLLFFSPAFAQTFPGSTQLIPVDSGWANNSVNAVSFRKNSLVSSDSTQVIAFYNPKGQVVVGKRTHGTTEWTLQVTQFTGKCSDAHNAISIMIDGNGFIHLAWDHHDSPLRYAVSNEKLSLNFTLQPMTGIDENSVTYPEFYRMKNGNLLFLYRSGASGKGKLVMNEYHTKEKQWKQIHNNLIDGEGQRNAYWQCFIDEKGTIHLSWVWRESADVASNHDMCYAQSRDNGKTWMNTRRKKYQLPITAATAEYAWKIDENHELINQTSMAADLAGNPYIATYWREDKSDVPQYHLIRLHKNKWKKIILDFRSTHFSLSGHGTKRIPIARPQLVVNGRGNKADVLMIFRDEERGSKVSIAHIKKVRNQDFQLQDLTDFSVSTWEPTLDTERWKDQKTLNLFIQRVEQQDAEGLSTSESHMVYVLEWSYESDL